MRSDGASVEPSADVKVDTGLTDFTYRQSACRPFRPDLKVFGALYSGTPICRGQRATVDINARRTYG